MNALKNYRGKLYIKVPNAQIMRLSNLVDKLNSLSSQIINKERGFTIWEFSELDYGLQVVVLLQEHGLPFSLTGEGGLEFIEVKE